MLLPTTVALPDPGLVAVCEQAVQSSQDSSREQKIAAIGSRQRRSAELRRAHLKEIKEKAGWSWGWGKTGLDEGFIQVLPLPTRNWNTAILDSESCYGSS